MWRCRNCNRRTDDKDEPNCLDNCPGYDPQKIMKIHYMMKSNSRNRVLRILCTGNPKRKNIAAVGSPHAVTCIKCREKLIKMKEEGTLAKDPQSATIPGLEL